MTRRVARAGAARVNVVDTGGDGRRARVRPRPRRAVAELALQHPGVHGHAPRDRARPAGVRRVADAAPRTSRSAATRGSSTRCSTRSGVESAGVVGNSMGGFIAAELAMSFPSGSRRLVLVSAAGLWIEYRRERAAAGGRAAVAGGAPRRRREHALGVTRPRLRQRGAAARRRYPEQLSPAIAAEIVARRRHAGLPPRAGGAARYPFRDQLAQIEVPDAGRLGAQRHARARVGDAREFVRADRRNARREIYEDTGHVAMLERPSASTRCGGLPRPRAADGEAVS